MGVGAGLYMCDVVKKSSRSLSHLLMSSCLTSAKNQEHPLVKVWSISRQCFFIHSMVNV